MNSENMPRDLSRESPGEIRTPQAFNAKAKKWFWILVLVQAVFLLVSGVYYPVSVLPDWLQTISKLSPATYVLAGMRAALLPGTSDQSLWSYVAPLLLMGVVMLPLGIHLFQRAERYTKRTGKLKRNG